MKNKRININLPITTLEKLNSTVPEGKRSQFIAETLEEKLEEKTSLRESIIRDLKENRWIHEKVMKEWSSLETEGWPEY
ncbi:MAG: hypothetical protein A2Z11_04700 [Candidatus Woykebacteria bacterium RBG_16_43_9]|uniref:Ribbon-helix-helix protein CopG domain-containing protein n=1 Tax=Candidatus Woykebacteria bacterium RBG_16_43_9 TaxID=1802596 RepID=A0A1G1WD37_9BACT|nr:MAG: hypothetical protein A2Z11_04700 [Candidatus Woykebacteria bacterium RBG_16_43_9]